MEELRMEEWLRELSRQLERYSALAVFLQEYPEFWKNLSPESMRLLDREMQTLVLRMRALKELLLESFPELASLFQNQEVSG